MAFSTEPTRVPTSIGSIYTTIHDSDGGADSIRAIVEIKDQNGDVMRVWSGDLVPHLTAQQIQSIQTFAANLRTQANDQLLP